MNIIPVIARQDESSHWYLIPNELNKKFSQLHEEAINGSTSAEDEFITIFSKYMCGGDINNKQLYIAK